MTHASPFPGGASGKEPAWQCRRLKRLCPIPGWGRSPGGGHGNPLQCSCLENPMDRGARWAIQPMWPQRGGHNWSRLAHTPFPGQAGWQRILYRFSRSFAISLSFPFPAASSNTHCPSLYQSLLCKPHWAAFAKHLHESTTPYKFACYAELSSFPPFFPSFLPPCLPSFFVI